MKKQISTSMPKYFVVVVCILLFFVLLHTSLYANNKSDYTAVFTSNVFIDATLEGRATLEKNIPPNHSSNVFHLFSHGKSGALFLEGQWRDKTEIAQWLQANNYLKNKTHLNIYGCEFAKGEEGSAAVAFLEKRLAVSIAASDDVTGIDGDWELEVGIAQEALNLQEYTYNLQGYIDCSTVINSSQDFIDGFVTPYKVKDGYTYVAFQQSLDTDFPITLPLVNNLPISPTSDNRLIVYIAIFDPDCNQILGTFYGGNDDDTVRHLEFDDDGNFIVMGYTESTDFPTTDGTVQNGGFNDDQFLLKFTPDGTLLWATVYGGSGADDGVEALFVDGTDIYTLGATNSSDFVTTDGSTNSGGDDLFITKYDGNGNLLYARLLGGSGNESARDIVPYNGGIILLGGSLSTDFPTTDGSTLSGTSDAALSYIDATGNIVFSKLIGGSGTADQINEMIFDGTYLYLAGRSNSPDFPTTDETMTNGGSDLVVMKLDLSGNVIYSTMIGSSATEDFIDLEVQDGMAYLVGETNGADYPVVGGLNHAGSYDMIMTKFDTNGNTIFSTYYGSSANDSPSTIKLNSAGEIFMIVGAYASPLTTDGSSGGGATYVKFNSDGTLCIATVTDVITPEVFTDFKNEMELSGDTLTVAFKSYEAYTTDGSIASGSTSGTGDFTVARFVFCPDPTPIASDVLTPSTINVCRNGIIDQVIGEELFIDGTAFSPIYRQGVLGSQPDIELEYQWQTSNAPTGPWVDLPGPVAQQQNYTPAPTTLDVYYRRQAKTSECCGGTLVSTSNVLSVLVTANTAPTVDAGGVFYTCSGSAVTIGGSPSATGGTAPYMYDWNNGAFTAPNPSVSPTESTVFTLFVTDNNGCEQADQAVVNVYSADAGADKDACDGASVLIGGTALQGVPVIPSGGTPPAGQHSIEYAWSPTTGLSCSDCPNPSASPAVATTYTLTVTINKPDGSTGQSTDMVDVGIISAPPGAMTIPDVVLCLGDMIELSTNPAPISTPAISSVSQTSVGNGTATAANLADGDFSTGGHTNDGENENITIDLGSIQTINQIKLAALSGSTGDDRLRVELSTDNVSFTEVAFYTSGVSATELTTINFAEQGARYIRLRSSSSFRDVSISEFAAIYDYTYIWTPGAYIVTDGASAIFDAGNLEMPALNPITYTLSATLGECTFYEQVTVAVIEARAGDDTGCGPVILGDPDRTPNIDETYSWVKITDPSITTGTGDLMGATNILHATASASVGGDVGYELTVTYTLNGFTHSCVDTVLVFPSCGNICDIETADGGCPAFDLGSPTMVAIPYDNNPENWTYSWTSNLGMTGLDSYTTQEVNLTDNITRTYTVTMTNVLDPSVTCSEMIEANSASYSTPVANTSPTITTCAGVPVNIGDPAENTGLTYSWTNGHLLDDASDHNPLATVDLPTQFVLTVSDNITGCSAKDTVMVLVPEGANAGPDLTVCDNGTVTIGANTDLAGFNYSWDPAGADWRNDTDENDAMPDVFVATTQTFTLTATDTSGTCTTTDMVTVTVEPLPAPFTLPDLSFCPSQAGALVLGTNDGTSGGTNQVPNGYIYYWSPAAYVDDPALQNPTVNTPLPSTSVTFEVEARTIGGCNARATQTINPTVTAASVINNTTICLGDAIAIGDVSNPTGGGEMYSWSPSADLNNATSPNPIFTPSAAGTTTFTVTKTIGGCSATEEVTIIVNDVTAPTLIPQTVCEGESVQIGMSADPALSYAWSPITDLDDATIANPTFSGSSSTNYTLTAMDGQGCTVEVGTSVTVNPSPNIIVELADTTVCRTNTLSIVIDATVSPSGDYAYLWTPETYLSNANDLTPTFYIPTVGVYEYQLEVIDQNTGCSVFETVSINVVEKDIVNNTITGNQTVCSWMIPAALTSNATSSGTLYYQWQSSTTDCNSGFSDIVGANSSTYTPEATNEVTYYRLITSNGGIYTSGACSEISNCVTININHCCPPMRCGRVTITRN